MIKLRKNEQKTLQTLSNINGKAAVDHIMEISGLAHSAIMRAAMNLSELKLIQIHEQTQKIITLNEEGEDYATQGLPERRLIEYIIKSGNSGKPEETAKNTKLKSHQIPIAVGWLHRKSWVKIETDDGTIVTPTRPREGDDEKLLKLLHRKGGSTLEKLGRKMSRVAVNLKRRKLAEIEEKTIRTLELTKEGRNLATQLTEGVPQEASQLTPEMIISGKWRTTKLRRFNVVAEGSQTYPGKAHPLQQMVNRTRQIFLRMGFTEIRGPLVETAFWNFDALFQPQDHPAREMQDTFYLSVPEKGGLPSKQIVDAVAKTHENGWITGSKGWGYQWRKEEAQRLVLRTHTTAETIKYLSRHRSPPIKVFSVDRVYRNEQLTYKNTAEFYQIEGIVVDKDVTLQDLMGTLKTFYRRFGLEKVEFWPCYFPYTEPSAQAMVYLPKIKRWIELCGMGMFRPEVLAPMKIDYPVLAWGGGLERLAMIELGLDDIRLLYNNNLNWLRRSPLRL